MAINLPKAIEWQAIEPELLSTKQAAALAGMGERTWWRNSHAGLAPAPVRIGGLVRYRRSEILEWIAAGCSRCDGGQQG